MCLSPEKLEWKNSQLRISFGTISIIRVTKIYEGGGNKEA